MYQLAELISILQETQIKKRNQRKKLYASGIGRNVLDSSATILAGDFFRISVGSQFKIALNLAGISNIKGERSEIQKQDETKLPQWCGNSEDDSSETLVGCVLQNFAENNSYKGRWKTGKLVNPSYATGIGRFWIVPSLHLLAYLSSYSLV